MLAATLGVLATLWVRPSYGVRVHTTVYRRYSSNRITTHTSYHVSGTRGKQGATPDTRGLTPSDYVPRAHRIECIPPLFPPSPAPPCAAAYTGGIPETPRMPSAAPHVCACGGRPLVRGCVWRLRGARARDACVPPSVGETEPTPPPRGATPTSRSRRMPPVTSHGAWRAHARWRCGACWSSAQRAPEPA